MNTPPSQYRIGRKWPPSLAALESREFRWLLLGNIAFFFALQGQILNRTFLAWQLTGSEMALASINLAVALPMLIGSIFGGAVSDRLERRKIVLAGQCVIVLNEVVVLSLLLTDSLQFGHLLASAFVNGCMFPFIMPARTAIVYNVVGAKRLGNAMALSGGGINVARVLGPALAGLVIDLWGPTAAYMVAVVLYSGAWLCMFGVRPYPQLNQNRKPLLQDVAHGFRYVAANRPVLVCLLFGLVPMFLAMPVQNLFVVFADQVWHVGERGFGILLAATGVGGALGAWWVARRGENPRRTRVMVGCALGFAVLLMVFSLSPWFGFAVLMLTLANVCASACQTLNNTQLQLLVDDSVRGRMSSFMMMSFGLTPLGVLPLAFAAEHIGAPYAVLGASLLLFIVVLLFYRRSNTLRSLDARVKRAHGNFV